MSWLILLYFIELGYAPFYDSLNTLPYEHTRNENVYYIHFDAEVVILDHLFIGGSTKIFMQPQKDSYQFYPIEDNFLFRAGFELDNIRIGLEFDNIEIGLRHHCKHPVGSLGVQSQGKSYGGFEEFYIRISGEY